MRSRSEGVRNVIRVNATSIDVTSSNTIAFGYINELARAGRVIAGRHRLQGPLPDITTGKVTGNVWRADSVWLGAEVMVEFLDPAIAEDEGLADTFEWEARAVSAVTSPFVNRVLDYGIECSIPYLVTQLPCGESLSSRIAHKRRPSATELAGMLRELALALDEMHALGILHRDLRSDRVFAGQSGGRGVTTLSFGIAKLMNDTLELVRTMARRQITPADSPRYSSPEQVLGTSTLGPRSDIWSLAVIAFEGMTGELPFVGASMGERLVQICTGEARVPSRVSAVPRGFDAWFARGVRKAAEERWGSALEMADALTALVSC